MSKHFLVTGATGFVGGHLVDALVARGDQVTVLVRDPKKIHQNVRVVVGSLSDEKSLKKAVEGVDGVFHIAALFREAKLPDSAYIEVNVDGTKRLLDAAITAGVKRFIYCSTNGVHGDIKNPPADETTPYAPCDVYQESKVQSEKVVFKYFSEEKIRGVILRPAMIYGPRDTRLFKIFKMIKKERFFYVGKGEALCNFIDVRDLVQAFIKAMDNENLNNEAYLIANETIIPLCQFCDLVADELGVKRPWLHIPLVPMQLLGDLCELICKPFGIEPPLYRRRVDFYIKNRAFNISKAKKELGFKPQRDFKEEVSSIIHWYKENSML